MVAATLRALARQQPPKTIVPRLHRTTVELTNGATIVLSSTSPRPYLKVPRDSYNNPLWNPHEAGIDDDTGRLARFNEKFGMSQETWGEVGSGFESLLSGTAAAATPAPAKAKAKPAPPPTPAPTAEPAKSKKSKK
ncbi:hypothetical protein RI367_002561 [Sorochytrium milnesiophthora]